MDTSLPADRIHLKNQAPVREEGDHVLYWMVAQRRLSWNFALDRALELARRLERPLLILEALRVDYPWASDRQHRFALDGMAEHQEALEETQVGYHAYVEPEPGAGAGLLEALAAGACAVVTDHYPCFFLPRMVEAAARRLEVRLEAVDSNGLLPLGVTEDTFSAAVHFRRFLQKELGEHLTELPGPDPLASLDLPTFEAVPSEVTRRWPAADAALLEGDGEALAGLPIDHGVPPVPYAGGTRPARARLQAFLEDGLERYHEDSRHPDAHATSRLSPWLHWGHISAHEVFRAVAEAEGWSPARLAGSATGKREGWWGMGPGAEAFLDELVTWRELGFVYTHHRDDYREYDTLPGWALETLEVHADDERAHLYTLEELAEARTHDPLWNAAQRQLREEGVIHGYLRMLWGKNILAWTEQPRRALEIMVELNNRWAVDGRDPNSWSGIFWTLGRFDRGWPERDVYGKVRTMTSASTRRKLRMDEWLARWSPDEAPG